MDKTCRTCKHLIDEHWQSGFPEEEVCCRIRKTNETECGECEFLRVKIDFGCNLWEHLENIRANT